MRKSIVGTVAASVIGLAGIGGSLAMATGASAATLPANHTVTATTTLHNRPDSGGNGNWATDNFTRTLQLHYLGKDNSPAHASAPYMYWATVSDHGTFRDMPGAFTPDQGGSDLGKILRPGQVTGPMNGSGSWGMFYSSAKANKAYVPASLPSSQNTNPAYSSPVWPELAFPAGTTFNGMNESAFDYTYHAVPVVNAKHVIIRYKENWEDASFNNAGQLPRGDGNITGLR